MALMVGGPKFQAFDSNGDMLNGGKVWSYTGGTDTLTDTYPTISDAIAGTNANTNPVTLNSRGEANIVVAGATKLVLKDSLGNVIWTVDNVNLNSIDVTDSNGNFVLKFNPVTSAANYFTMTNSTTGNNPALGVAGLDTNIGIRIVPKAAGHVILEGPVELPNGITGGAVITGNVTIAGGVAISGPVAVTGALTATTFQGFTLPSTTSTANHALINNGTGTLSFGAKIKTISSQVFTSSGTYTATTGVVGIQVVVVGGGGGGGSCTASSNIANGSGGGAGAVCRKFLTATQAGTGITIHIGAGGAAGVTGESSTAAFTVGTMTAAGGSGGGSFNSAVAGGIAGGTGGAASGGDSSSSPGGNGGTSAGSYNTAANTTSFCLGGHGGNNPYGCGGIGAVSAGGGAAGGAASGYGGGGGGATIIGTGTATGGAGSNGLCVIIEYISD